MAGSCEHGDEPSGSIKCGEFPGLAEHTLSFSRRTLLYGVSYLVSLVSFLSTYMAYTIIINGR
jgi:hypothetical protein